MKSNFKQGNTVSYESDTANQIIAVLLDQGKAYAAVHIDKIDYYAYLINNDHDKALSDSLDLDGNHVQEKYLMELNTFDNDNEYLTEYLINGGDIRHKTSIK